MVPVHPPSPYAARIRRPSRALNPRSSPRAAPPRARQSGVPCRPMAVVSGVSDVGRVACGARFPTRGEIVAGGARARPAWVEQGIPPAAHCSIVRHATRDTTLSCSISERSQRALFWAMSGGSGACPKGTSFTSGARSARAGLQIPFKFWWVYELVVGRVRAGSFCVGPFGIRGGTGPPATPPYAARIRRPSRAR